MNEKNLSFKSTRAVSIHQMLHSFHNKINLLGLSSVWYQNNVRIQSNRFLLTKKKKQDQKRKSDEKQKVSMLSSVWWNIESHSLKIKWNISLSLPIIGFYIFVKRHKWNEIISKIQSVHKWDENQKAKPNKNTKHIKRNWNWNWFGLVLISLFSIIIYIIFLYSRSKII